MLIKRPLSNKDLYSRGDLLRESSDYRITSHLKNLPEQPTVMQKDFFKKGPGYLLRSVCFLKILTYTVLYVNSILAEKSVKPLLTYNSHTTHAKYTIQQTSVYSDLYNQHPQSNFRTCSSPSRETPYPAAVTSRAVHSPGQPPLSSCFRYFV